MALTKDFHIRHDALNWKHDAEEKTFLSEKGQLISQYFKASLEKDEDMIYFR